MKYKVNIKTIVIIITASSLLGIFFNVFYSKGIPLIRKERQVTWTKDSVLQKVIDTVYQTTSIKVSKPLSTNDKVKIKDKPEEKPLPSKPTLITTKQAYSLFKSRRVLFIDARDKWDFADGHIKGAINIAEYSFDKNNPVLKTIPKDKAIVTYCGGDDCEVSTKLAGYLFDLGYKNIFVFLGGWNEWQKAGYEVEVTGD